LQDLLNAFVSAEQLADITRHCKLDSYHPDCDDRMLRRIFYSFVGAMVESCRQGDGDLSKDGQKALKKWFNALCESPLQQLSRQLAQDYCT